jgi:hypothetical protein
MWRGGLGRGDNFVNGTCQWRARSPERERAAWLASSVHKRGMMVPRVALLKSHRLEREGEATARKSCLRSCFYPSLFLSKHKHPKRWHCYSSGRPERER